MEGCNGCSVCPKNMLESQGESVPDGVRPAMMYGAETWAVKKNTREEVVCGEMTMLRWMCGVRLDRIRNERIIRTAKVGEISMKVQEGSSGIGMY